MDWDEALGLMTPEAEWETDPRHPRAGIYRGREAVRSFIEDLKAPFEGTVYTPTNTTTRSLAEKVRYPEAPRGQQRAGRGPDQGLRTLRDGQIARGQGFGEREKALAAAGLSHQLDQGNTPEP